MSKGKPLIYLTHHIMNDLEIIIKILNHNKYHIWLFKIAIDIFEKFGNRSGYDFSTYHGRERFE